MSPATMQDHSSVNSLFNVVENEMLALFKHLSFEFFEEFDVFARVQTGRTRDHEPLEQTHGFLHCYYKGLYGDRLAERELQNTVIWLSCSLDRPPSRDAVDRFFTIFNTSSMRYSTGVEQAAARGLLELTYCIDSTDLRVMRANPDASSCYDPTKDEYYYDYDCTILSTGQKFPIAAEFTESRQAPEETVMRVT